MGPALGKYLLFMFSIKNELPGVLEWRRDATVLVVHV